MKPKIAQLHSGQVSYRLREEHLSAVAGSCDARRAMHVQTDVTLVALHRLPRVQADAHAHRALRQHALGVDRSRDGIRRTREGDEERVPLSVDLHALVPLP